MKKLSSTTVNQRIHISVDEPAALPVLYFAKANALMGEKIASTTVIILR